jgi:hypothetical protein
MQNTRPKERRKKKTKILRLFNPSIYDNKSNAMIKTIDLNEEYTRIDFNYRSSDEYINGGWIQMERNSFIRDTLTKRTYPLLFALNIPIAPQKHHFQRKGQAHTYTLVFPALPKSTKSIDIIEKEAPGTYFNYYNIEYQRWINIEPHTNYINNKN